MTATLRHALAAIAAGVALSVALPETARAQCTIVKAAEPVKSAATVVGRTARARHLHTQTIRTAFAFRCTSSTLYSIAREGAALAGPAARDVTLTNAAGATLSASAKLISVGGKALNLPFAELPASGYTDTATAGRVYDVVIELTPQDEAVRSGTALAADYLGAFMVTIHY